MSNDQKPARIRAVSNSATAASAPYGAGQESAHDAPSPAETADASGPSVLSMLLFLLGCGAGGAAVAALPYYLAGH